MAVVWSEAIFCMKFKSTSTQSILFRKNCAIQCVRKPRCTVKMQKHSKKIPLGYNLGKPENNIIE